MKRMAKSVRVAKARKASVNRRVAVALAKFLKQANPAMKTAGASVQRLKGGVIKITPIKANAAGLYVVKDAYGSTASVPRSKGESAKIAARLNRTGAHGKPYKVVKA